jgi:threonine dehydrogenase-like Zn-dependent dehydrogenase
VQVQYIADDISSLMTASGTFRYTTGCFEEAVDLINRGIIDVKALVSHVYDFKDSLEAFESVHRLQDCHGKKMLKTVILHGNNTAVSTR